MATPLRAMSAAEITRPQSHARDRNHAHGSFATHARARSSAHTGIAVALMERADVTLADKWRRRPREHAGPPPGRATGGSPERSHATRWGEIGRLGW